VWGVWGAWRCGRCGGVGSLLTFDIPQTALVATLDTYDFFKIFFLTMQRGRVVVSGNLRSRSASNNNRTLCLDVTLCNITRM
jgi:hypothetical protein